MNTEQKRVLSRIIISALLIAAAVAGERFFGLNQYIAIAVYLVSYLIIGYDILRNAVMGIFHGQIFDENFLMAVATVGAFCLGEYTEGVAVMLFYQTGELFQSYAVGKSRRNISALMDIRPDYANVYIDGRIERVDPDDVEVGTEIIINPGERVPIDSIITGGSTTLNTSALTGESIPRDAAEGDEIISGCINLTGAITARTTKAFGESTVSAILDLVENSSMKKAKSENFITKFAKVYTPAVCIGALLLALLPPIIRLITGENAQWSEWIIRALTFLVISCPCALVISIPLSFFAGIGCASGSGILVKGSNYLEALSKTKCIVFDKTGTLTKGVFEVTQIHPFDSCDEEIVLEYAALAEAASSHPISMSIKKAYGKDISRARLGEIKELAGYGVCAIVDGKQVLVGNRKLMEQYSIEAVDEHCDGTAVYVANNGQYMGCIMISDVAKPSSAEAISLLKSKGIRTVMLSGDTRETAERVADELGIDEVFSELLPEDKVSQVERLLHEKRKGDCLAFVGDGINDAPVLSRADIGIAMGALGSDAAIEAADIVLMDDNPLKISKAMKISEKCLRIVYENIYFSIGIKLLCLVLGALGIANMWMAIFADVGVMVIAVLNAIRCLKIK